jgi:hypothetical protein
MGRSFANQAPNKESHPIHPIQELPGSALRRSIQMIRCNTSISLITVTGDGWPAGCTGDAGDTLGGCAGGTGAAATTAIDEASRLN